MMLTMLTAARVVVVSGKGGVGKTTVAAALGVAAARRGDRVLIADLEDRESVAPIFGRDRLPHDEREIADGIVGVSVIPDEALVEYFRVVYKIPRASRALLRSKAVEFATQVAPGLRDILLIGTIMDAERRRRDGTPVFDTIVVDAPPTGRLPRLLDAPRAIADMVRAGPIKPQALKVLDMVTDPRRLHVVLVTNPEEMPVRETIESIETLQKLGVTLGPVIVNGIWPALPSLGRSAAQTLRRAGADAGIELSDDAVEALASVASAHARRVANQRDALADLDAIPAPRIDLPYLFTERIGSDEIGRLATLLKEHL